MKEKMIITDMNNSTDLKKLSISELFNILEVQILYNKSIYCVTSLIFEICSREFQLLLNSKSILHLQSTNLKRIQKYIELLNQQNKLDKQKLPSLCQQLFSNNHFAVEILWWLNNNNIFFFEEYWSLQTTSEVITQLKQLLLSIENEQLTIIEQNQYRCIIRDIFLKFVISINASVSSTWCTRNHNIFNRFLDEALDELICNPNEAILIKFIKVFSEINTYYDGLIKTLCKNIVQKLLIYQEKITLYNALLVQELWTTKELQSEIVNLYFEILKRFSFVELIEIIREVPEYKLNWRILLTFISVYINKVSDSFKQLKNKIGLHLQAILSEEDPIFFHSRASNTVQILGSIALVRQACLEQDSPESEYSEWYSYTLGSNSILRSGTNISSWCMLISALNDATQGPVWALKVHAERALRAPPGQLRHVRAYKDTCRLQVEKMTKNASFKINNVNISVLSILEQSLNNNEVSWIMRQPKILENLLSYILGNATFIKIKDMLIAEDLLSENDLKNCKPQPLIVDENDSEDFS